MKQSDVRDEQQRSSAMVMSLLFIAGLFIAFPVNMLAADVVPEAQMPQPPEQPPEQLTEQLTEQTVDQPPTISTTEGEIESRGDFSSKQRPSGHMQMVVPGLTQQRIQIVPPRPVLTWDQLWDQVWRSITSTMPIEVAASVGQVPMCQGNLAFNAVIKDAIWAIANRKYGESARLLGLFQDRSHCLTARGIRGLDAVLTVYLGTALRGLQRDQADIVVPGVFNLGLLIFDQLQYSKASFWRIGIAPRGAVLQQILKAVPSRDSGVWLYDFDRGLLVRRGESGLVEQILEAFATPSRFGDGNCSLLEMTDRWQKSSMGFQCPRGTQSAAGMGGSSMGTGSVVGGVPTGTGAMCIVEVARTSGSRGQLACMKKAVAGVKLTPDEALKGPVWSPPIFDKACSRSGVSGLGTMVPLVNPKIAEDWLDSQVRLRKAKAENEMIEQTLENLAEAALLEHSTREGQKELRESSTTSTTSDEGSTPCPPSKLGCGPGEEKRTVGDDLGGSGGCGRGSNAAARAQALYQCAVGGASPIPTQRPPSGGQPTSPLGNPTISRYDPEQQMSKMPAAMACAVQGGDMPRMSLNDMQCAAMKCPPDQPCPCNRSTGLIGQPSQPAISVKPVDPCRTEGCPDPQPTGGGVPINPLGGGGNPRPLR